MAPVARHTLVADRVTVEAWVQIPLRWDSKVSGAVHQTKGVSNEGRGSKMTRAVHKAKSMAAKAKHQTKGVVARWQGRNTKCRAWHQTKGVMAKWRGRNIKCWAWRWGRNTKRRAWPGRGAEQEGEKKLTFFFTFFPKKSPLHFLPQQDKEPNPGPQRQV